MDSWRWATHQSVRLGPIGEHEAIVPIAANEEEIAGAATRVRAEDQAAAIASRQAHVNLQREVGKARSQCQARDEDMVAGDDRMQARAGEEAALAQVAIQGPQIAVLPGQRIDQGWCSLRGRCVGGLLGGDRSSSNDGRLGGSGGRSMSLGNGCCCGVGMRLGSTLREGRQSSADCSRGPRSQLGWMVDAAVDEQAQPCQKQEKHQDEAEPQRARQRKAALLRELAAVKMG